MKSAVDGILAQGENSAVEFNSAQVRPDGLAREMIAFANTFGGVILIGVEDNGQVSGLGPGKNWDEWVANVARNNIVPPINPEIRLVSFERRRICMVTVTKGPDKPYQALDGKFWVRVGSTVRQATKEELSRLFQAAGLVHFDISPVVGTVFRDLDEDHLERYFSNCYQLTFSAQRKAEKERLLLNSDFLARLEGKVVCTVGGLLLFGRLPQRRLPHSSIVFAAIRGREITDQVPYLIEKTQGLISRFLPAPVRVKGSRREETRPIPALVLREALVNAVAHRDYSISSRKISVTVFSDRVEIVSPGRLPNTVTLEKIKTGNSAPRNLLLVKVLDNLRYIDGLGRGIPLIIRAMGKAAVWAEEGELLRLTLFLG